MYYNLFDSHSHSENSPDASDSIAFMTETAISKGLQGLAITDHCEINGLAKKGYEKRIQQSAIDTGIVKNTVKKDFVLMLGIEIAQIFYDEESAERILASHPFDFVIGSLHKLLYEGFDYYKADYGELSPAKLHEYNLKYFEELMDMINWGNFDILGHISFFVRYPKIVAGIDVDLTLYREQIDEALRLIAEKGKGIEINASGLRNAMNDTLPPLWVLKRFRELGGEIVTIGSDAHKAQDVGHGVARGMDMLTEAGFEYFAFFRDRKPVMLKII